MSADWSDEGASIHSAAKLQLADGALAQLRHLHAELARLTPAADQAGPLPRRIARGLRRARRNGWRWHRYPRDIWRGVRATDAPVQAERDVATLRALTEQGQHDQAIAFAAALLPTKADDAAFLEAARKAFAKAGALSLQAAASTALRRQADSPARRRQEQQVLARIRETDPTWWPQVPAVAPDTKSPDEAAGEPGPTRVLHLLKVAMPYRQSGYTLRSKYIVDSQRAAGLEPVVMTALGFPQQAGVADPPRTELVDGIVHHHLELGSEDLVDVPVDRYLDAYAEAAAARAAEISPSVLHVHSGHRGYEAALVGVAVARALGCPLVYEVRGFFESLWSRDPEWNERGEVYARRRATETRCMQAADAVVTLSETMRADIIARGIDPGKVFVTPNGVDTEAFRPGPAPADLVEQLGLAGKFVFGYVSNLDHYREGHEALIRAAVRLRSRGVPAVALIVGDGGRRGELEELATRERAGDAVVFTGKVPHDRVLDYYRLFDVFVVPRVPERAARLVTPLKPFEAMAVGLPVVVSDLDALLEIVGDDRGRSFRAGDGASLADVLTDLHHDPDLRMELGKRARDWVVAERQWSANGPRYRAIYDTILAASPR